MNIHFWSQQQPIFIPNYVNLTWLCIHVSVSVFVPSTLTGYTWRSGWQRLTLLASFSAATAKNLTSVLLSSSSVPKGVDEGGGEWAEPIRLFCLLQCHKIKEKKRPNDFAFLTPSPRCNRSFMMPMNSLWLSLSSWSSSKILKTVLTKCWVSLIPVATYTARVNSSVGKVGHQWRSEK